VGMLNYGTGAPVVWTPLDVRRHADGQDFVTARLQEHSPPTDRRLLL